MGIFSIKDISKMNASKFNVIYVGEMFDVASDNYIAYLIFDVVFEMLFVHPACLIATCNPCVFTALPALIINNFKQSC